MEKLVILDRDGTINIDPGHYVHKKEHFNFIPKAIEALRILQDKKYKIMVVTNQGGISKGIYSEEQYLELNQYFLNELKKHGITIEKVFHCPHKIEDNCECRKPKTKLVESYLGNMDKDKSYMVGDKTSDIKFGKNLGIKTILVKTGFGGEDKEYEINPTRITQDVYEATQFIIKNERIK